MTHDSQTLDSIRELNLSYLLLAQRVLTEDRDAAQAHLGLSAEMAQTLTQLSPDQTVRLASSSQLLCFFRLGGDALLTGLASLTERAQSASAASNASLLVA
ncbi:flagellar transcriptional regulator FlhD [Caballeronia sp. LP006]|jgi:flagellar transcriptional activator FlhD|uniref:flagellar transcriptional regulator FlhD n=1 Tax=unclassified Caballeronia TaxID=2646786 RepID=UPI002028C76E|nr:MULTISPECIES: flagellar transcriptional regulator FlhD [unclassified Caballeronia]MDR5773479.1 flagellar transcriptional regulator FlhD [Caballeronia sp. LZ002]MDR5806257.1 flagellar transcriptional regulator FlhD [Caballeronia sp. LZ001]MDR5826704.1 flagellar transcriptional regulator FlhD [Caballeronia sp. LP006]MDR5848913.1 flagellar transcriptional regulator FlhD [Caballeronia sp. LZ003]